MSVAGELLLPSARGPYAARQGPKERLRTWGFEDPGPSLCSARFERLASLGVIESSPNPNT